MGHNWFAQEQQLDETMDGMLFVWIEKHTWVVGSALHLNEKPILIG